MLERNKIELHIYFNGNENNKLSIEFSDNKQSVLNFITAIQKGNFDGNSDMETSEGKFIINWKNINYIKLVKINE